MTAAAQGFPKLHFCSRRYKAIKGGTLHVIRSPWGRIWSFLKGHIKHGGDALEVRTVMDHPAMAPLHIQTLHPDEAENITFHL